MKTEFYFVTTAVSLALSVGSFAYAQHYTQVNLVANTSGVAPITDPNLGNPWGISRTSDNPWWISDSGKGRQNSISPPGPTMARAGFLAISNPSPPNSRLATTSNQTFHHLP